MLDKENMEITQATPPTEEEMLEEAKAWGYDSVEEFFKDISKAMEQAEKDVEDLRKKGYIV